MNERSIYYDFCRGMFDRFKEVVNGKIIYEIYPEIDVVIFKVFFKDFEFAYAVNNVSQIIYDGSQEKTVEAFVHYYKKEIFRAFFKN